MGEKKSYYMAIIICEDEKFNQESADELKAAMQKLMAATAGRGSTEIYQVTDEKAFLKFREDSKNNGRKFRC